MSLENLLLARHPSQMDVINENPLSHTTLSLSDLKLKYYRCAESVRCDVVAPAISGAKLLGNGLENMTFLGDNFRLRHKAGNLNTTGAEKAADRLLRGASSLADCYGSRYRGTSLIRNSLPLGPYSRTMPWPYGGLTRGGALSYERGTPVPLLS